MKVPPNEQHEPIQKRRGYACRFCREVMEPGTEHAAERCPARSTKEAAQEGARTIDTLKEIGGKMRAAHAKPRSTRKKAKA